MRWLHTLLSDTSEWDFKHVLLPMSVAGLMFEIAEGGFLDIDVKIVGPEGKIIHQGERETSGKYTFAAHTSGVYTYCFSNQMSTMTPKVVMFNMEIGDAPKEDSATDDGE